LLKRDGKVFDCPKLLKSFYPSFRVRSWKKILAGSTVHTDGWKAYDGLVVKGDTIITVFFIATMNLLEEKAMLMASKPSGASQRDAWLSLRTLER
jgi:hypothetical protein